MNKLSRDELFYGGPEISVIVPRQPITMVPINTIAGVQIRQTQVAQQQPVIPQLPINTQRVSIGGGNYKFYVQFARDPSDPNYSGTSISSISSSGNIQTSRSIDGPGIFIAPATSVPGSIGVQQSNVTGATSSSAFGSGSTNRVNRT